MTADMLVESAGLDAWVESNMNVSTLEEFRSRDGWIALENPPCNLSYDAVKGVLRLHPDPARLKSRNIGLRDVEAPADDIVLPSGLSAFMNMRGGEEYLHEGEGDKGRQPLRLDLDGAVNIKNWVLEGRGGYLEKDMAREWQRGDVRMVHDLPDQMVRLAAGDLSYPVASFQSYQPMLGFSIARNFSLQPYRVTTPAGETSFVLSSTSSVDILVNGRKTRSLRLDPGTYNVSDFPVLDGGNDVVLVITDSAGNVETKRFSLLGDQALLKKGLHEYAYNIGVESRIEEGRKIYDEGRPVLSMFHRLGFSDTATVGVSVQGDETVQQSGVFALKAFRAGNVGAEVFVSRMEEYGRGAAARMTFRRVNTEKGREFSALAGWRSARFSALGQAGQDINPASFETAARYSLIILDNLSMGIGGRYRFGRDASEDEWSYSVNASKAITREISLTLSAENQSIGGAGVFASLTWSPPQSRHSIMSSVDTITGSEEVEWQYRAERDVQSWRMSAGTVHERKKGLRGTGSAGYEGYRGTVSFRHDLVSADDGGSAESRSQVLFGTALVYAGGKMALSQPVNDSFILLVPHKMLAGETIGINPAISGPADEIVYQAEVDGFGPAVLPGSTSYMYRSVRVDARHLPAGYDIGRDFYTVMPSYKSGTLLTIGNAANIYADGHLIFTDGRSVAFASGMLRKLGDTHFSEQEFFTNAEGRFRITRLEPGTYEMRLNNVPAAPIRLDVPEQAAGRFDAGTVFISEEKT